MRRFIVASAILAIALLGPLLAGLPVRAATLSDSARATAALDYLLSKQLTDGSIDDSIGETADFVIGAATAGYDPATLKGCSGSNGALDYLAGASDAAAADAAKTGKTILAVVAAGGDPSSFAGRNLLSRLISNYDSTSGAFGDGSTFSQSFAILALVAADRIAPLAALAELRSLQDSDGSWNFGIAPVDAGGGDTNSTAIALMALNAAGDQSDNSSGLAYLATQQQPDGGFPYSSTWGPTSDPDSDSIVLEALVAAGENPQGPEWTRTDSNGVASTVLSDLRSFQGDDGGYAYPGQSENAFTTSQVPQALAGLPYSAETNPTPGRTLPGSLCSVADPSTAASSQSISPSASALMSALPSTTPSPAPLVTPSATPVPASTPRPTPRATVRPTEAPSTPAVAPDGSSGTDLLPSPTQLGSGAAIAVAGAPGPTSAVAGSTSAANGQSNPGPASGGVPVAIWYALAATAGLVIVAGAGWLYFLRPGKR